MNQYDWKLKDVQHAELVSAATGLHEGLATTILSNLGESSTPEDIQQYLGFSKEDLPNPKLLPDIDKGVKRIVDAINKDESILIFGDQDCDGICATTVMFNIFKACGAKVKFLMSVRDKHGYGLSFETVPEIVSLNPSLVVTVDCGISSYDGIADLKEACIDTVITDHHELLQDPPPACAIIDPKVVKDHPLNILAGVAVSWCVAKAVATTLKEQGKNINMNIVEEQLAFVALATVVDMVPLQNVSRSIVKAGLDVFRNLKGGNLISYARSCKVNPKYIDSGTIGFKLGPRINAMGKTGDAASVVTMFVTKEPKVHYAILKAMEDKLITRKESELVISHAAIPEIETQIEKGYSVPVVYKPGWTYSTLGLVANTLKSKYNRPCILLTTTEGSNIAKGSARSIDGYSVLEMFDYAEDLLYAFGGHMCAAGLSIRVDNIDKFRECINEYFKKHYADKKPELEIDASLDLSAMNWEFFEQQERLQPFGMRNKEPVWLLRDVRVDKVKPIGTAHKSFELSDRHRNSIRGIMFNCPFDEIPEMVDIVCQLKINRFAGKETLQLFILDIGNV